MEGLVNLRGETQWEDLSLLPDKASPRKSGSSNHIMHVSRYITNEMEVMLDQFWFWSASPTFPYFRHDFSDKISSNCGIPWIFHGFSDIFLPSSSADAVTPSRRHADSAQVKILPKGFMCTSPLKARGTGDICFCFSLKNDSLGEKNTDIHGFKHAGTIVI